MMAAMAFIGGCFMPPIVGSSDGGADLGTGNGGRGGTIGGGGTIGSGGTPPVGSGGAGGTKPGSGGAAGAGPATGGGPGGLGGGSSAGGNIGSGGATPTGGRPETGGQAGAGSGGAGGRPGTGGQGGGGGAGGRPGTGGQGGGGGAGGIPAFGCAVEEALAACYTFDSDTGTMVIDGSAWGNHGVTDAVHVAGMQGGMALRFSSGKQTVRIPHHASLNLVGTNATLEAWVRPAMFPMDGALDHIIAKQSADPMNGYALGLHLAPAGAYQFGGYSGGSGVLTGGVPNQGWTHIAVVWLPDESISLYQDGNPVRVGARQDNGAGLALVANQEALILGNRFPLAGFTEAQFAFYGDIDMVRIYRRSRTAQEICNDANRRLVSGVCM